MKLREYGVMSTSQTILVVDDDPQIRDVLKLAFERADFETIMARDGAEGLELANQIKPSLAVLDIGLPEMDGLELCKEIRRSSDVPILFLTARDDEVDRIVGLELGGDDYVTKPFSPRELVARVRAILKRTAGRTEAAEDSDTPNALVIGVLSLVPESHVCKVRDTHVTLTSTELSILEKLMSRPTQVFSRPAMVDAIWGPGMVVSDRTLDSHLRNLRSKLAEAGCPDAVETLHGVGLRMGPCLGT
jgi:two-component system OmpR family response regulator